MEKCNLCPRQCNINRKNSVGFCQEKAKIRIAKIIEHFCWEEPCLSKEKGTLAIFFSGCNLKCDYCQNHEISRGGVGKEYSIEEFAKLINEKQNNHDSIDLITPTHFSKELHMAFQFVNKKVPVIWNTNSYETLDNVKLVSEFVDIFLADFKYADDQLGMDFSCCKDYFSKSIAAISLMCQLKLDIKENDFLKQGVVIRHLVLPYHIKNSLKVLDILAEKFKDRIISIMSQFTPNGNSKLDRPISAIEYKTVVSHMQKLGLKNGFLQDFTSASTKYVPKF